MKSTVDILIPHYCDPAGLELSLESIQQQVWRGNIRVVVFDDGSPKESYDEAVAVCEAHRHRRIAKLDIIRSEVNLGRPRARNRLLDSIESEYVSWLDAGDVWYPEKLRRQFDYLYRLEYRGANVNTIWVTCDYDWTQHGKTRTLSQDVSHDQYEKLLLGENLRAYLWTLLGTAEAFKIAGIFDERLARLQDLDYFLAFVKGGGRIVTVPQRGALCQYFKSDIGRKSDEVMQSYRIIRGKNLPNLRQYPAYFLRLIDWKHEKLIARFARANGDFLSYLKHTIRAAFLKPKHTLRSLTKALVGR